MTSDTSKKSKADQRRDELRELLESDLYLFAKYIFPEYYYGDVHKDFFQFLQYGDADCLLGLIPRDHLKSHCAACLAAWLITKYPRSTINYVSANSDLSLAQMRKIKHILSCPQYYDLWPDMLNWEVDRGVLKHKPMGVWTQKMFEVDHPDRKRTGERDATVNATSVGSQSNTGLHCLYTIYDDLVTDENYNSEADKKAVLGCFQNFAKISSPGAKKYAVGTRYGDDDLYAKLLESEFRYFSEETEEEVVEKRWSVFSRVVEDSPMRTGDGAFCWPRGKHPKTGEWYGFNRRELAMKKADLSLESDLCNFFAQYYNDPNDSSLHRLNREDFRYYNSAHLVEKAGQWYMKGSRLKIYAAADLAFTEGNATSSKRRDFTAICVIGVDDEGYIYLLSLERFQTDKMDVYYERIIDLWDYWGFRKIVVETNNGGKLVKRYLEDEVRRQGGVLEIDGRAHTSHDGPKEERIAQVLEPRYRNGTIYHPKGGYTKYLEEELVQNKPAHRDLKDALAICIAESKAPRARAANHSTERGNVVAMTRFGAVRGRRR